MSAAVILGTGGHAQVLWAAWQAAYKADPASVPPLAGWLEAEDYDGPDTCLDLPVFRESPPLWAAFRAQNIVHLYPGIGMVRTNPDRWALIAGLEKKGMQPATLIHPAAVVDPSADIAAGCYIGARAVIQPFARLHESVIVNTGAIVEHHAVIGRNVHVAPGAVLCGEVAVGNHSVIGAGAVIIQRIAVGQNVTVGAASVVVRNIPDNRTAMGNPARLRCVPEYDALVVERV
jgi:sugar O-acyltransferase (sialic acid O-acetyltransferase NeuD family)